MGDMALTLTTVPEVHDYTRPGEPTYRHLPQNLEAEKALLGAVFVNNQAYDRIADFLKPEHFALPQHGRIFQACKIGRAHV